MEAVMGRRGKGGSRNTSSSSADHDKRWSWRPDYAPFDLVHPRAAKAMRLPSRATPVWRLRRRWRCGGDDVDGRERRERRRRRRQEEGRKREMGIDRSRCKMVWWEGFGLQVDSKNFKVFFL